MQSDGNVKQIAVGYWIYPHIAEGYILPRIRERLLEPHNADIKARITEATRLRARMLPTVPAPLELELRTNPFLRCDSAEIRRNLKMETATDAEVFAELRRRKDNFK